MQERGNRTGRVWQARRSRRSFLTVAAGLTGAGATALVLGCSRSSTSGGGSSSSAPAAAGSAAAKPAASSPVAKRGGIVNLGHGSDITSLDPTYSGNGGDQMPL